MAVPTHPIEGVRVKDLRRISDDRGYLVEMLRSDWPEFETFAQCYATACYPGVVKAWHYHTAQWDHFVCIQGVARIVLYDPRENSPTRGAVNEFRVDASQPALIKIPPLVYHGFTSESDRPVLMINFPTQLYNYEKPDEYRVPYDDPSIPYDWNRRRE
ncbi:MAG: dTDP-4-dehydrorhamnose 3,5-epimerase family protein [Gemmatimonadota bacterium]|nr:MAG: dTDP-4-dehydrorhamnose 3,5-epimerase family protein [Gemmatimonadota bacterium]